MHKDKKRVFLKAYLRAILSLFLFMAGYIILSAYFIRSQTEHISEIRHNELMRLVKTAYNLVKPDIDEYKKGNISAEKSLSIITGTVRKMTYEDIHGKNYFFMSSFNGKMLVQPFEPEKEGSDQWDLVDSNGVYIIRELAKTSKEEPGEGFVTYHYFNPAFGMVMEKMSYVKGIPELGCYIGIGLYMDDIKRQTNDHTRFSVILAALIFSAIIFFVISFLRPVLKSSEILIQYFEKAADSPDAIQPVSYSSKHENRYVLFMIEGFNRMIEKISDYSERLLLSKEKFRSFFENSADAIIFITLDGEFLEVNSTALQTFGYSREDIDKLNFKSLLPGSYDFGKILSSIIENRVIKNYNKVMLKKNGSKIDVLMTAMIHKSGEYDNSILYMIIRDITENMELEKQLIQTQKMETIGTLAGGIAHDFNNYLGAITGTVSLLKYEYEQDGYVPPDRFNHLSGILEESCLNASKMITQLQAVSGKSTENFSILDFRTLTERVYEICRNTIDKSIDLKISITEKESFIFGDSRIEQVILNLCINAAHSMTIMRDSKDKWGGELSIYLYKATVKKDSPLSARYGCREGYYEIAEISDTGIGIDPENLEKIFDPFFSTKGKGKGSGLGLSIAYKTAAEHDGFITVESEKGKGSRFSLYLPSHKGAALGIKNSDKNITFLSGNILIIDDEKAFRSTLTAMLEFMGLTVETASGAYEGIEIIENHSDRIDMVIMDVSMPGLSGTEAYRIIKTKTPEIKILLTSGYANDPRIEELIIKGIDGFIQKPYTISELNKILSNLLSGN